MRAEKTTLQREFRFRGLPELCRGYEIHMGETRVVPPGTAGHTPAFTDRPATGPADNESPLTYFTDGHTDGYFLHEKCWGTYLHGILDNTSVINELIAPYSVQPGEHLDYRQYKEEQYDKLAALLRQHLAIDKIYSTLQY
jgi:adenosylcobyric acid synthase